MAAWNRRDFATAQSLFRGQLTRYPDSPWASDALLHLAYAALAHNRYAEAEGYLHSVVNRNEFEQ